MTRITGFIGCFALTFTAAILLSKPNSDFSTAEVEGGPFEQIALIYIGSSTCVPSNDESIPDLVAAAQARLSHIADSLGVEFTTIGIAQDRSARRGLDHLDTVFGFEEVLAGGGWNSIGIARYVWDDLPGAAHTPQIVVTRRLVNSDQEHTEATLGIPKEHLITRKVGLQEISDWQSVGFVVPLT